MAKTRRHRFDPRNLAQPVRRKARTIVHPPKRRHACECGARIYVDYEHGLWACSDVHGCGIKGAVLANGSLAVTARPLVQTGPQPHKGSRLAKASR